MSTDPVRTPPRARALPELQLDALLARCEDLVRCWAIALILERPLAGIGGIPLEDLAREGPSLCTQALRALQSDVELDRLTGRGEADSRGRWPPARRLAAMVGALDASTTVDAVEALRGVLWEALVDEQRGGILDRSAPRGAADISDRLAYICSSTLAAAIAAGSGATADPWSREDAALAAMDEAGARQRRAQPSAPSRALIVDEHPDVAAHAVPSAGVARSAQPLAAGERRSPVPSVEIEIHDQRGRDSPTAWIRAIGERLELFDRGGVPFAVLLVEILELDSLRRSEDPDELARLAEEVEGVLASERGASAPDGSLSSADSREEMMRGSLTRQRPGRYWLLVGASDRPRAEELAGRLRGAVAARVSYRRAPLEIVIGTAACPEDGRRSSALAAHADVGLYAARSDARAAAARRPAPVDESVQ